MQPSRSRWPTEAIGPGVRSESIMTVWRLGMRRSMNPLTKKIIKRRVQKQRDLKKMLIVGLGQMWSTPVLLFRGHTGSISGIKYCGTLVWTTVIKLKKQ